MLAETLVPRDSGHPENLDRVAAYVEARFREAGAKVTTQPFTVEGRSYRNVIAHFGREDGDLIVVGAASRNEVGRCPYLVRRNSARRTSSPWICSTSHPSRKPMTSGLRFAVRAAWACMRVDTWTTRWW